MDRAFSFDRSWLFPLPPSALWDVLTATHSYRQWWPWLRQFDAPPLAEGSLAHCVIGPPIPFVLHVVVNVQRVTPPTLIEAAVDGDLVGPARLELEPDGAGTRARLVFDVELRQRWLRLASNAARPIFEFGRDRVIAAGVEQFRRRALAQTR